MKKQIGNLLGRLKSGQSRRALRSRRLNLESLEGRRLLAADLSANHNYFMPEDVNLDFNVSPLDSLLVINALNQGGSRSFAEGEIASGLAEMLDVNGDNFLSPIDALMIINRLNGEGEDTPQTFISYSYTITDNAGNTLPSNSVVIGDTFRINVFVKDVRPASARTVTDPNDPSYVQFNGVYSAANDIGVSDLSLVTFVRPTTFFSGVRFDNEFFNDRGANQGGGIQIGGGKSPSVADGNFFTITTSSKSVTFEFDVADTAAVTSGRTAIPVRALDPNLPDDALSYTEVTAAIISAIQGAGLGLTPVDRGAGVIGFNGDQFTLTSGTSSLSLSSTNEEYLNEVKAFQDRSRSLDPDGAIPFYSVAFTANATGAVTFTPNGPERLGSENLVFGSKVVIPNSMINFGAPITINIINDPTAPVAVTDTLTSPEDTALVIGANVTGNDIVTAGRTLALDSVSAIAGVTQGTVNGTTYTPPANFFGTDRIVYVVRDSTGLKSAAATVTINVSPVNDPPVAQNDAVSVFEGSTSNTLNLLADNGFGVDTVGPSNETSDSITITRVGPAVGGGTTFTTANGGVVTILAGAKTVNYVPAATFVGTDTFVYTITDTGGLTSTATVTVDVAPESLPFARRDTGSGAEGGSVVVAVLSNDSFNPGSTPVLKSFSQGSKGTVARQSNDANAANYNVLVYTPSDSNFYGTDTFTYVINDSSGLGIDSTGSVTITITDVNDPPVLTGDTATTAEDTPLTISVSTLLSNDNPGVGETANVPAQTLTLTGVTPVSTSGGTVVLNGSNVVYTPAANFVGNYLFSYTARDSGTPALSATATVTITVTPVNDNPIANPDTYSGTEDTELLIPAGNTSIAAGNVLFNDAPGPASAIDEASQTLSVTAVSSTSSKSGTVSLNGGVIRYMPAANFNGADTFTYTLADSAGGTATGTITVNVAAVNDTPIATADSLTGFRDIPLRIPASSLLGNDLPGGGPDEATQTLSISAVTPLANTNGQVVLNSDGSVTYTPTAGFAGAASFQYTVRDSGGATATAIVSLTIREFVPSTIEGTVFADDDGDDTVDDGERRLGGVLVTLTGTTSQGVAITPQTRLTLANGGYSFTGLGPGTYSVSYSLPKFLLDAPGPNTHGNIALTNPAGTTVSGKNFAVLGNIDLSSVPNGNAYQAVIDQFASSRPPYVPPTAPPTQPEDVQKVLGAYFALGSDNAALWSTLPPGGLNVGTNQIQFAELVLAGSGMDMVAYLTIVDSNHRVMTRTLSMARREFFIIQDADEAVLVGIRNAPAAFQTIDLGATPPFTANKYLDSVDTIFAQEGWDD